MRSVRAWIAVAAVVLAVGAGTTFAISSGGGHNKHATTPTSVPASRTDPSAASPVKAADPATQQLIDNLANQLLQATNSGGQPKAITPQEAEAMLRQQLQQLGVSPSK